MNGTNIEVLSKDNRIKEFLSRWYPLTETTHIVGLYKTILASLLTDGLCFEEFRKEYPHAPRHGSEHMCFVERMTGVIAFQILKVYGQCPTCLSNDFILLPHFQVQNVQVILCQSCSTWAANNWFFEWVKIGSGSGG